jgi:hypothetical protein
MSDSIKETSLILYLRSALKLSWLLGEFLFWKSIPCCDKNMIASNKLFKMKSSCWFESFDLLTDLLIKSELFKLL